MKKRNPFEEKMCAFVGRHHMIEEGDLILCGVSGGADSICMLQLLYTMKGEGSFQLAVCHVNHGIRETAARDQAYVEQFCREREIPFFCVTKDVPTLAKQTGKSLEEAGREARYEAFEQIAREINATKIALAHTANDRAETQLYHLFRGTGIKGLASILPVRDRIIRPILCFQREEVEEYLAEEGISFMTDETNESDAYTRNRIRHHILPVATKEISGASVLHMAQTAAMCEQIEDYLSMETDALQKRAVKVKLNGFEISVEEVQNAHAVLQSRLCHALLLSLTPGAKDIGAVHVESLLELFSGATGKQVSLPFGIEAIRQYETVLLYKKEDKEEPLMLLVAMEKNQESAVYQYQGVTIAFRIFSRKKECEIAQNEYTKWFDYGKIKSLEIRARQTGDTIALKGKEGMIHKSLKQYMIDEKIPKLMREKTIVLADGENILWVVGHRISEAYKISDATETILEVKVEGFHEGGSHG